MSEKVKALSERDKVRRKISVWLGSSNHNAVKHCARELIGNTSDEILKGNGNQIVVTRHNEKKITIEDNCKGLPVEGFAEDGQENWKLLFNVLFAGTKYENGIDNNDYTVGSNGLFLTVLTFASKKVSYEVARPNGNVYSIKFEKGELVEELNIIGESDKTYTKITYELDDEIFEGNFYTYQELCDLGNEQSSLIDGEITVIDVETNQTNTYKHENGIHDLLDKSTGDGIHDSTRFQKEMSFEIVQKFTNTEIVDGEMVEVEREVRKMDDVKIDTVFKYTHSDEDNLQIEFLNGSNLVNHGTIYDGFVKGMRNGINKKIKSMGLYNKNEKQITKDDILVGLNYVISFKSYFPIYESQTKFASHVVYFEELMQKAIEEYLEVYFIENNSECEKILNKVLITKRSRESAENTRNNAKKKLEEKITVVNRPKKLHDCRSTDKNIKQLYLLEGDSAVNGAKAARDAKIQAIFPLKGKSISVYKKKIEKILDNEEVINLYRILGCGVDLKKKVKGFPEFNIDNLQYNEINILTDQDDDGLHIRCLLIAMFWRLSPELLIQRKINIVESPLHRIKTKNNTYLAYSDKEKREIIESLTEDFTSSRFKGIGELDPALLNKTAMNVNTRRIAPVTIDDIEGAEEMLKICFEIDPNPRKKLIEEFGDQYFDFEAFNV